MKTRTIVHVEINGTARCAANDVDTLESVNQHHDSRSQHDAHTRSFTGEEQGKKNSDQTDHRKSQTPTSWNILVLDAQSTTSGERSSPRQPQDSGSPTSCKPKQSRTMPDNSGASERGERTTCNHVEFCAMAMCSLATVLQNCGPTCDDNGNSAMLCCRESTPNRKDCPRSHDWFEMVKIPSANE